MWDEHNAIIHWVVVLFIFVLFSFIIILIGYSIWSGGLSLCSRDFYFTCDFFFLADQVRERVCDAFDVFVVGSIGSVRFDNLEFFVLELSFFRCWNFSKWNFHVVVICGFFGREVVRVCLNCSVKTQTCVFAALKSINYGHSSLKLGSF